jgi:hypothetical protein
MIEVLKQALEALEYIVDNNYMSLPKIGNEAIISLRQAIAKLESQEPVAEARFDGTLHWLEPYGIGLHRFQGLLYTTPPAHMAGADGLMMNILGTGVDAKSFARAIEAKLKEKNKWVTTEQASRLSSACTAKRRRPICGLTGVLTTIRV